MRDGSKCNVRQLARKRLRNVMVEDIMLVKASDLNKGNS